MLFRSSISATVGRRRNGSSRCGRKAAGGPCELVQLPTWNNLVIAGVGGNIFGTGGGATNPAGVDGLLATAPYPQVPSNVPVTVTMGGLPCLINYTGAAPYLISGVTQINAQVPKGVTPGPNVPLTATIGGANAQTGVTLAVK